MPTRPYRRGDQDPTAKGLMVGLGFRGVIEEKHSLVGARDRAGLCHSLAAANDAGNGGRVVRVAVGRSSDEFVGKVETSERVHRRHFKRVMQSKIRKQARDTLSEHGLADTWRAMEEHVVPTCCGYLTSPLRLDLTDHIRQVKTTACMPAGSLPYHLDRVNRRYRAAAQKRDQLSDV
jgi:hypothetical protein